MAHKKALTMVIIAIVLLMSAMIVAGCTSPTPTPAATPTPVPKTDLTVFAAASLSSAFNQTKAQFEIAAPRSEYHL